MNTRHYFGLLVLLLGICSDSQACTSFALKSQDGLYMGKNLDWGIGSGYFFINERGEGRTLLGEADLCWRSRYRSLTFNQLGKDFPLGGMNEKGLVVEELNMPATTWDPDPAKTPVNEFQLVQYLLDNCASVEGVKLALDRLQLKPLFQTLHYFIADRQGNMLVAECNGREFIYHDPVQSGIPVLSNNPYQESLRYLKNFQGFGGDMPIRHRQGSNERFVSVAAMLASYAHQSPLEYAFQMLDTVKQTDTRWSLVYDLHRLEVHFRFQGCEVRKVFCLREILARESVRGLGGDLSVCGMENPQELHLVSTEENARLLRKVFLQMSALSGQEPDYNLLYALAMKADHHLPHHLAPGLVDELNQAIRPLPMGSPLDYPDYLFENLADWGRYAMVGLGEATHGTREFCRFKHRMFKYLVEHHGYRVLAYEYSFRKSLIINEYVLDGTGDIDSILTGESWIQNNAEVKDLIRWMRGYNQDRPGGEKIHFIGIDTQVDAIRLPEVLQHLERKHPDFYSRHKALMDSIAQWVGVDYEKISRETYEQIKSLYREFESAAGKYGGTDRALLELIARSLIQSHEFLYAIFILKENPRDRHLADNALCICNTLASHQKVVLWAHNAHVANNPDYYGPGKGAMGMFLKDSLQDRYLAMATSFSRGEFKAVMIDPDGHDTPPLTCKMHGDPPGISSNFLLHSAKYDSFILKLRQEQGTLLKSYLHEKRPLVGVGDCYLGAPEKHFSGDRILRLDEAYDLLFYFGETHPVTL
jgi:erythromycin esterase-like protein